MDVFVLSIHGDVTTVMLWRVPMIVAVGRDRKQLADIGDTATAFRLGVLVQVGIPER